MNSEKFFQIYLLIMFLCYQIPRIYYRLKASKNRVKQGGAWLITNENKLRLVLMFVSGVSVNVLCLLFLINRELLPWSYFELPYCLRWLGCVTGLLTVILSYYVHKTLGLNFTPTLQTIEGHQLITSGIYRWLRHPMYTSFFLLLLTAALLTSNWLIALMGTIYSLLIINRIKSEESMLLEVFGDDFRCYQQSTGMILPHINMR